MHCSKGWIANSLTASGGVTWPTHHAGLLQAASGERSNGRLVEAERGRSRSRSRRGDLQRWQGDIAAAAAAGADMRGAHVGARLALALLRQADALQRLREGRLTQASACLLIAMYIPGYVGLYKPSRC